METPSTDEVRAAGPAEERDADRRALDPITTVRLKLRKKKLTSHSKVPGGKNYLVRRILAESPGDVARFADVFGGGGVMTYNVEGVERVWNDLDPSKYAAMWCVQNRPERLRRLLEGFRYTPDEFELARDVHGRMAAVMDAANVTKQDPATLLSLATHYIARSRMSRGGLGDAFAWSDRLRGGQPGDLNAWMNALGRIGEQSKALAGVELRCMDFRNLVGDLLRPMAPRTLFYFDPPYLPETRSGARLYGEFELGGNGETAEAVHGRLAVTARDLVGHGHAVVISHYDCHDYRRWYPESEGWRVAVWDLANHSGQNKTKQRRREAIFIHKGS